MATILFVLPHNSALVNNLLHTKTTLWLPVLKGVLGNWLMINIMFDKFEICSQKKKKNMRRVCSLIFFSVPCPCLLPFPSSFKLLTS